MKKLVWMFVLGLLLSFIIACSKPESAEQEKSENEQAASDQLEPEENAELLIWGNGDQNAEWMNEVIDEFTAEYDIDITFEEISHTDAPEKLQTDGPAGIGADVFMGAHDHVGSMNQAGLIYDNYFEEQYQQEMMEGAVNAVSSLNEEDEMDMYGYPISVETLTMLYNQDLLDEMGFEPAETMDELIDQSKQLMEEHPDKYGFMFEPANLYGNFGFMSASGAYIFGDNNTNPEDIGLNNEGGVAAAELFLKVKDEILGLSPEDLTGDVIGSYFDEGNLMYMIDGPWSLNNRLETGINFGSMVIPKVDNGDTPSPFLGVKALFVNAYSDYPQAATLFAQFATSYEMLEKRYEYTGEIPPIESLQESETIVNNELLYPFVEQAQEAIAMPNITEMQYVWEPIDTAYSTIWKGNADPQEALDRAVEQIEETIDSELE
ncbi:sugar ABC transporter substrate-binding protein [Gracilibacillus phocaeensis]|uniref:sugar ABC transporter substrate-binding protein n=1 Tax=Gracilibacillus phocaeensis TaxID=2042304 RepID=UPI0010307699|nr:maltose ABC transporter substrate-binding protein [Gracilibacillus phocaeensis]